jgi:hypothetical protein
MMHALLNNRFRRFEGSQCLHFEGSRGLGSPDARLCDARDWTVAQNKCIVLPAIGNETAETKNMTSCLVIHLPCTCRLQDSPKRRYLSTELHGVTSQKSVILSLNSALVDRRCLLYRTVVTDIALTADGLTLPNPVCRCVCGSLRQLA